MVQKSNPIEKKCDFFYSCQFLCNIIPVGLKDLLRTSYLKCNRSENPQTKKLFNFYLNACFVGKGQGTDQNS